MQTPSAQVTYLLWPALRDNQTEQPSKLGVTRTFPAVSQGTLPTFPCARGTLSSQKCRNGSNSGCCYRQRKITFNWWKTSLNSVSSFVEIRLDGGSRVR